MNFGTQILPRYRKDVYTQKWMSLAQEFQKLESEYTQPELLPMVIIIWHNWICSDRLFPFTTFCPKKSQKLLLAWFEPFILNV